MFEGSQPHLQGVPLFPLPNVVLFPGAVLPLHIFEERYKTMMRMALDGDRQIAMALLRPGWEKNYYGIPAIEPVVCVGTILTHERLPDGKYNLLLQGVLRAQVAREYHVQPYRTADLQPIEETHVMEIDVESERQHFADLFDDGPLANSNIARQFRQILAGPLPTGQLADLLAFNFLEDVELKQQLLAEGDVKTRIARTLEGLQSLAPTMPLAASRAIPAPHWN